MALTDQPYLPLYVDDWMNNNKLKMCSPAAHGVMISIMCVLHKEENYGKLLLKQKFKQTNEQIKNFAIQIAKLCAFDLLELETPFNELIEEKVLKIEGNFLVCQRMVDDAEISKKRAKSGSKGGRATKSKEKKAPVLKEKENDFASNFAKANTQANTVIVNVNENGIVNDTNTYFEKSEKLFKTEKEFLTSVCNFFSQTTPELQVNAINWMATQENFLEFKKQTQAYIDFKIEAEQKMVHGWSSYSESGNWKKEDWVKKLENFRNTQTKTESKGNVRKVHIN